MRIPGINKITKEICWVDLGQEFIKMETHAGELSMITDYGTVLLPQSISDWNLILSSQGCMLTDRNVIVSATRIESYNEERRMITLRHTSGEFEEATVSKPNHNAIKKYIDEHKNNNKI